MSRITSVPLGAEAKDIVGAAVVLNGKAAKVATDLKQFRSEPTGLFSPQASPLEALSQRVDHGLGQALARLRSEFPSEPVSFRILEVQMLKFCRISLMRCWTRVRTWV